MVQSYAVAVAAALSEEAHVQSSAHTCGLFLEVLVVLLWNLPAYCSCGPYGDRTQRPFGFKMPCCWDLILRDPPPLAAAESVCVKLAAFRKPIGAPADCIDCGAL